MSTPFPLHQRTASERFAALAGEWSEIDLAVAIKALAMELAWRTSFAMVADDLRGYAADIDRLEAEQLRDLDRIEAEHLRDQPALDEAIGPDLRR